MKKNIPAAVASTNAYEALEDWARSRVQVWLQDLLEDEVTQFLGREKSERGADRRGYRNGHGKPRRFAMMNGTMEVRRPRVRNTTDRFESQVLPYFRRKSKQLGELLPDLYLHVLATGDFEQAMRGLLGAGAPLSRASIQRLKSTWQLEYDEWVQQDLSGLEVVYQWADGLYVKTGIAKERAALMVIIGALSDGRKKECGRLAFELPLAVQLPPLENLVCVDAMRLRHARHRYPRLQRLFNDLPTICLRSLARSHPSSSWPLAASTKDDGSCSTHTDGLNRTLTLNVIYEKGCQEKHLPDGLVPGHASRCRGSQPHFPLRENVPAIQERAVQHCDGVRKLNSRFWDDQCRP